MESSEIPALEIYSQPETDMTLSMFPVTADQSPVDKGLSEKDFLDVGGNQSFLNTQDLPELDFLDSVLDENNSSIFDCQNSSMNSDLINMLSEETTADITTLLNYDFQSEIPISEQSYEFVSVPSSNCEAQNLENDCFEVSSTTNALLNLSESCNSSESVCISHEDEVLDVDDPGGAIESIAGLKYLEMRRKNNIASQRSRKVRKQKDVEMTGKLKLLQKENVELKTLVEKLEKERDTLQQKLLSIFAKK